MPTIIETEKYRLEIRDGSDLLEYTIKEGITYDAEDAIETKARVTALHPGERFYVLGKGIEFFNITAAARALAATKEFSDNTIAVAFYTSNISLQLIGEMYVKLNKPAVPTKIFKSLFSAQEWLNEQMNKNIPGTGQT
ncbi:MAG: hypothetical protein ACJ77K_17095 [Bacteroidia bacterium]